MQKKAGLAAISAKSSAATFSDVWAGMLETLTIRDIVLIERLELDFSGGLNVLTGETGAGKSILLDSLGFALGRRDARGLVRAGAEEGAANATIACTDHHPVRALLEGAGIGWDDDGLTLRRVASSNGRSRAFINDQRVSADLLRSVGEALVEVHGQQDDRGLLNTRGHRALLDQFAGSEAEVAATRATFRDWRAAEEALVKARADAEAAARDREYLEHAAKELATLAPEVGEDAVLDAKRRLMQAAERIREEVVAAATALGPDGAEGAASDAMRRLDDAAPNAEGRLDRAIDALGRALEALGEASSDVEAALEGLSFDPLELEQTEERLFALRGIARKHNILPDQLPEFAAEMQAKLTLISDNEANEAALIASVAKAEAAYHKAAKALTAKRTTAAKALDKAVAAELPELKMERAQFRTVIAATDPGIEGAEKIAFEIATNPGAPFGPLAQIASGGELSRFLLALKVALAGRGPSGVMVFDEIDRGVGGATADAVGRRLSRLAESDQVLVVTHSPQVAAKGDQHFRIQKSSTGEVTRTDVVALTGDEKRDEIARMLSGDTVTDAARAAAGELIS